MTDFPTEDNDLKHDLVIFRKLPSSGGFLEEDHSRTIKIWDKDGPVPSSAFGVVP